MILLFCKAGFYKYEPAVCNYSKNGGKSALRRATVAADIEYHRFLVSLKLTANFNHLSN